MSTITAIKRLLAVIITLAMAAILGCENERTPLSEGVPECRTYFTPLRAGGWSDRELEVFCAATDSFPVVDGYREVTDPEAIAGGYITCCRE